MIRTKRFAAAALALVFSILLFIPASAVDYDPGIMPFSSQPIPVISLNPNNKWDGFPVYGGEGFTCLAGAGAETTTYVVAYTTSSGWSFVFASPDASVNAANYIFSDTNSEGNIGLINYSEDYDLHYSIAVLPINSATFPNPLFYVPIFSSLNDALAGIREQVDDPGLDPAASQAYEFTIPAGYVCYIELMDPTSEITIQATMPKNSAVLGSWWLNTTTIRDGASYPSSGDTFPNPNASRLNWIKNVTGGTNFIGQTKSALYHYRGSNNLIEIYNPYHYDGSIGDPKSNPTLYVSCTGLVADGIRFYALADEASIAAGSIGVTSISPVDYGDYWQSNNTPPEIPSVDPVVIDQFTDQDDDPTPAPSTGGYNEPMESAGITDILQNFFKSIIGLFTEGHDAIRNLTENAQQFVSRLSSLYSWLPPQILGVLTSAIILAIIIGVLKVFL